MTESHSRETSLSFYRVSTIKAKIIKYIPLKDPAKLAICLNEKILQIKSLKLTIPPASCSGFYILG